MKKQDTKVGGCCMGIPFGCSSVLLLVVGVGMWQHTGSPLFVLGALVPPALVGAATAMALTSRWVKRARSC